MSKRDLAVSLLFINVVPGAALGLLALYLNPTWPVWLGLVSLLFINVVPGAALGLLALYLNPTWPVWLGLVVVPGAVVLYVATIGRVVSRMVGATIAPILRARSDRWDS